jgi:predicted DNA-binding protein with PD1-like motif
MEIRSHMRELFFLALFVACGCAHHPEPAVRYLSRTELKPNSAAPGAQHRLIATRADGSKEYALVLARGDEVMTALTDFARTERVTAASFTAIGAVRGAEVGWFDFEKQQYKAMRHDEQLEVLSLLGDIGLDGDGQPTVHAHATLGRESGRAFGGHLIRATVSPTLEVFLTTYAQALKKQRDPKDDVELFQLSSP